MDITRITMALRHCIQIRALNHGMTIHSHLIKLGGLSNTFLANNLISVYIKSFNLHYANKLFDEMPQRNIITWTTMVSAYTDVGRPSEALQLYNEMLDSKSETPNGFMYSAVLKACGLLGDLQLGKSISEHIFRDNLEADMILMNSLLDMFVKCGSLNDAQKVFDKTLCPNTTSWNTMISGYAKAGLLHKAVNIFHSMPKRNVVSWNSIISGFTDKESLRALECVAMMHKEGFKLDEFTFPCALKTCALHGLLSFGKELHSYVIKLGFESSCFSLSALIDMYSNCNSLSEAVNLFGKKNLVSNNLALWNSILSGYIINNHYHEAFDVVLKIYHSGSYFDSYTFSGALKVCINLSSLKFGRQVHSMVVIYGYELDYIVGSILIDLYAKLGCINEALGLFNRLPKKDTIAWSGLIMGCAQMDLNRLAFSLFKDMVNLGLEIDHFLVSTILKVCSTLASITSGRLVHCFCIKKGYELEKVTVTSLIDMYSKCGEIQDGLVLFGSMPEKDTVSWTGIIVGCGQNGRAKEAIRLFYRMIDLGIEPNEITFLGVLSACRHAGLVKEAQIIFDSMKVEFDLEPYLEHYCCMVDVLGQAGFVKEAKDLIVDMPFEPTKATWNILLGACGAHKNREVVEFIVDRVKALDPVMEDPSSYVTLSNTYGSIGIWDELGKVREAAKKMGVKEAGISWIEISS